MEVVVLEANNPPARPVLAIHAGSVRRQAKLEVNQPFVIPHPGSPSCAVEVSLLTNLASQLLPDDGKPEAVCGIPVRKPDGAASQVKLRVRRGGATSDTSSAVESPPKFQSAQDTIGVTRDYLDHHQLQQRIQSLIQDVLREQPDDPYRYMLEQLRRAKAGFSATPQSQPPAGATRDLEVTAAPASPAPAATQPTPEEPLVPRPPEKPRPADTPKRPQGRNLHAPQQAKTRSLEVRKEYRACMRAVLNMPECQKVAVESLCEEARGASVKGMSGNILARARERAIRKVFDGEKDVRSQARATLQIALQSSATLLSSEYQRALTKWTASLAFRGAANIIGSEPQKRKAVYAVDDFSRRVSLPQPIVFLSSEGGSWGSWLGSSGGGGGGGGGTTTSKPKAKRPVDSIESFGS